jgi:alpha-galactosidase
VIHLRGTTSSIVIDNDACILHWGEDLGELTAVQLNELARAQVMALPQAGLDVRVKASLLPDASSGWVGVPPISIHREGRDQHPRLALSSMTSTPGGCVATFVDARIALQVTVSLTLDGDVVVARAEATNRGRVTIDLSSLVVTLPVAPRVVECENFAGRWSREFVSQRHPIVVGQIVRENRRGRTSHDCFPAMLVGSDGFNEETGEVWAAHLAWSGNHRTVVERLVDGRCLLQLSELLEPGEIRLAAGQSYATPPVHACWSGNGRNGVRTAMHDFMRRRSTHPTTPRRVLLNTWEAVYFDHQRSRLFELAERAAQIGVERFVLDDGWFRGRDDDTTSLGDWFVDARKFPDGLAPLAHYVDSLGMDFGLWVEPEMVNPDSDLLRAHPDWVLGIDPPVLGRHQLVLDLQRPEVSEYLFELIDRLLRDAPIAYLKWDMNRDHVQPLHDGAAAVHGQTLALYALLDRVRAAHPNVEIESCASGGARIDHGVLAHTDRVWTSDCNDAMERQRIHEGASLFIPPELLGAHIGPTTSHTTGRTHTLGFRALTALPFHLGIEWDVTSLKDHQRAALGEVVALHKQLRSLLHSGDHRRWDCADVSLRAYGVVARDLGEAVVVIAAIDTARSSVPRPLRIGGLDAKRSYRVRHRPLTDEHLGPMRQPPPWMTDGVTLTGHQLATIGLALPVLHPESAILLQLNAEVG